ncbi:MAG: 50S ribosomal protein L4, partial [Kofleriaceae bacterium]
SRNLELSARNLPGVTVIRAEGLNVYDILRHDQLVVAKDALDKGKRVATRVSEVTDGHRREEIARKRPRWLMAVAAGCAALAIGVGLLAMKASDNAKQSDALARQAELDAEKARQAIAAQQGKIDALESEIRNAKTEIEKRNAEIAKKQAEAEYVRMTGKKPPKQPPGGKGGGAGSGSGSASGEIKVCTDQVLC